MIADLYDFDKTVYNGESETRFWLFCLKKNPKIILFFPKQVFYAVGYILGIVNTKKFKENFFCFIRYIDAKKYARDFWKKESKRIVPWFNPKENDIPCVVCSASPVFEIEPILKELGVKVIIGTVMDIRTGKIHGENCKGDEKVRRINRELPGWTFRNAYSDNLKSDKGMLNLAENQFHVQKGKVTKIK